MQTRPGFSMRALLQPPRTYTVYVFVYVHMEFSNPSQCTCAVCEVLHPPLWVFQAVCTTTVVGRQCLQYISTQLRMFQCNSIDDV